VKQTKVCPDCSVNLIPIHIVDRGSHTNYVGFDYTVCEKPSPSWFSTKVTNSEGGIQAYLCGQCQRVLFYAHPGEKPERR
jgi:hypothetical protein